jgi:L-talarate/galactarate dehydratase
MKIERVTVEVLETPVELQYVAAGYSVNSNWHVLSRVYSDEGVQGIGFAVATRPALVKALAQTVEELGQSLVGTNSLEIEAARARMKRAGGWVGPGGMLSMAISTLDIALWDSMGKTLGQPLYRLLGGYRDRVRAYASDALWYSLPIDVLQQSAQHHVSQGYDTLKLRLGHEARPEGEAARVRAVEEAVGPDVQIMVDAAESWNGAQAMAAGRALQEAGIVWLEDPVSHQDLAGLAHLAQSLDVPIAAGEHLYGLDPFQKTFDAHSVDIAIIDLARVGGITPWIKVAAMAEARGIPVAGHVIPEVHVHLLSAVPNGYLVEYMPRSEPIFMTRLKLEEGHLLAPQAPGLGVELDEAACEKYRVQRGIAMC